jgi:hypothetical protein
MVQSPTKRVFVIPAAGKDVPNVDIGPREYFKPEGQWVDETMSVLRRVHDGDLTISDQPPIKDAAAEAADDSGGE